jgi:phosphate transport system permease protein
LTAPATVAPSVDAEAILADLRAKPDWKGTAFRVLLLGSLLLSLLILFVLGFQVVTDGWAVLSTRPVDFLQSNLRSDPDEAGVRQALMGTLWLAVITAVVAFPLGVGRRSTWRSTPCGVGCRRSSM